MRSLGRFQGRLLGRASPRDLIALGVASLLGIATIVVGRRAALELQPAKAVELSAMIEDLDAPTRLPNAQLVDLSDRSSTLFQGFTKKYVVLSFYAPWCGPCQKELPELIEQLGDDADVLVVVAKDEDLEHTRRQLSNLDLLDHGALIDVTGELFREARVTALPTTYVVNNHGAVRMRSKGYSPIDLFRMRRMIAPDRRTP